MTLFRVTPTSQPHVLQFMQARHQIDLRDNPVTILLDDLATGAVAADTKRIRPLALWEASTCSADVFIVYVSTVNNGRHYFSMYSSCI